MQKLIYLSNSRDYTEQGNINENKYFTNINGLLDQGWQAAHITHDAVEIDDSQNPSRKETFAAFVYLKDLKKTDSFLLLKCRKYFYSKYITSMTFPAAKSGGFCLIFQRKNVIFC